MRPKHVELRIPSTNYPVASSWHFILFGIKLFCVRRNECVYFIIYTDIVSCTCNICNWMGHKDIDTVSCTVPSITATGWSIKTLTLSFVPSATASGLLPRDILKSWAIGKWRDTIHRYEIEQGCWNSNDAYIIQRHKNCTE